MANPELIQSVADYIAAQFNPNRIILFGSHARGDARDDSDVYLFVEMERVMPRMEQERAIRRSFAKRPFAMDIIVYTPEEIAKWSQAPYSLAATVLREGRVLYERR